MKGAVYFHATLAEGFWTLMEEVKPVDQDPCERLGTFSSVVNANNKSRILVLQSSQRWAPWGIRAVALSRDPGPGGFR
jgi:hypothetical protein